MPGRRRGRVWVLALIGLVAAALAGPGTAGAAIAFRGEASANDTDSILTVAKPTSPSAVVAGDLMLAHISVEGGSGVTITAPTGWTLVVRTNNGSDTANAVYRKIAGSSEPSSYDWGLGTSRNSVGGIVAYSGVDTTAPVNAFSSPGGTGDSTSVQAPAVTTTVANAMIVGFFSIKKSTSFTPPGGMTERYDRPNGGSVPTGTAADVIQASAASTGSKTATAGAADKWAAHLVALKPFVNQAPTCQDVALVTTQDTTGETDPNCSDSESNPLTYSIVGQGAKGTASVVSGKLQYVPNAGETGSDTFTYRANDGTSNSNTSTVNVTIEVSCKLLGTTLTIAVPEDGAVAVSRDFDGDIVVTGTTATCAGSPTVLNVDTISVTGTGGDETLTIDVSGGNFSPGLTNETGDTDEIEWQIDLGLPSASDELVVTGSDGSDVVRAGAATGINFSNDGDADVSVSGVELLTVNGGEGNDNLHGIGAFGNDDGGWWTIPMHLNGDAGDDKLQGGLGDDELKGGLGNDKLSQFKVGDGADVIEGGDGKDALSYSTRSGGVNVLIDGLANDGELNEGDNISSDVEVITGGGGFDVLDGGELVLNQTLQGGPGNDVLLGGPGVDSLNGGAGGDDLYGEEGRDTLNTIDGVEGNDSADGGAERDVCKRDASDGATNCEA